MRELDPRRVIADLRELDRLTGGAGGAERVCWTEVWEAARGFLRARLDEIPGVQIELDEAGNLWAALPGESEEGVALGSHLDSVPAGGWLDGALGVMAALEVLRACQGTTPARSPMLVDWADEEGARFGRSLFGSSAVAGTLDVEQARGLRDSEGRALPAVLAEHGVELDRVLEAQARRAPLRAYLELHIEQGPVLEREGISVAAVSGTFGVERHSFAFQGQASHAGTTPMGLRRDAGLAAARTALAVDRIARDHDGVGTAGALRLEPGIPTAVAGHAELLVDLRHAEAGRLAAMLDETRGAAQGAAADRGCRVSETRVWNIEPIPFDERLVAASGQAHVMASGALHDAAEMARHVPTAMLFTPSSSGLSHTPGEDTPEADLESAIHAFGRLAARVIGSELP
ncbi:MAG TPA: Zn-dependent hydrolase [Thermoleophilaceae bacterium]|nr:Zn-dependent hydrolase [Thermoleophilaceae bacterium]